MSHPAVGRKRDYLRRYYQENKDKIKARSAARYERLKDEINARLREKKAERRKQRGLPPHEKRGFGSDCKRYYVEITIEKNFRRRIKLLQKISGKTVPECVRCGLKDVRGLEVNHIHGGGRQETLVNGRWRVFADQILSGERNTDDLNVMCATCNRLYEYERGKRRLPLNWVEVLGEEIR